MLKTALIGLCLSWCAPATLCASVVSDAQFSYPVPQSVLDELAAEQARLPSREETLRQLKEEQLRIPSVFDAAIRQLQEEQSRLPPIEEVIESFLEGQRALPPLQTVLDQLAAESARIPPIETLLPWHNQNENGVANLNSIGQGSDTPEPQTWLLAVLGLGAVAIRKKHKKYARQRGSV
jgi:hypothetical protein